MDTARPCTYCQYLLCILVYIGILTGCTKGPDGHDQQATAPDSFALEGITIAQLQEKLKHGEYTSEQIVKLYLDRSALPGLLMLSVPAGIYAGRSMASR